MSTDSESQFDIDGVKLYAKTWTPNGPVKAKVVFVHGYSEHINRYNEFFSGLASQGLKIFSWDQRGWGKSAAKPQHGHTGTTERVLADIAAFVGDKLSAEPVDAPLFVLGHSMGGGEVCTLMGDPKYEDLTGRVRGWALEAPLIGFTPGSEPSVLKVFFGRLASHVLPKYQMKNVIDPATITRDPEVVESIRNDPLCHDTGTLEGLASMLDRNNLLAAGKFRVNKNVKSILLVHGTADSTCSYAATKKWIDEQESVPDRVSKSYEGGFHQLHSDLCKDEFAADLLTWVSERVDAKPDTTVPEPKL